jgi:hypothetical protein
VRFSLADSVHRVCEKAPCGLCVWFRMRVRDVSGMKASCSSSSFLHKDFMQPSSAFHAKWRDWFQSAIMPANTTIATQMRRR